MVPPSNCLTRSEMNRSIGSSLDRALVMGAVGKSLDQISAKWSLELCRSRVLELTPWPPCVAVGPQLGDPLEIAIGGRRAFAWSLAHILDQGLGRLEAPGQNIAPVGV